MARLGKEELELLKIEYGVPTIWSWSRFKTYMNSPYEYFLRYVKEIRPTKTNVYLTLGSWCHEIVEGYYNGETPYEKMVEEFQKKRMEFELMDMRFDNDPEKSRKMADKYLDCCEHFYKNHKPLSGKIKIEEYLKIRVGKHLFGGYYDAVNFEDNIVYITDWKTSTIYKGEKISKECGQLLLYAEGFRQLGVPTENIRARWNFLKYAIIKYTQKNKNIKETIVERNNIVNKMQVTIRRFMKELGYDPEHIEMLINGNDWDALPEDLKSLYTLEDCYVYVDINEKSLEGLKNDIISTISEIENKIDVYERTKDDEVFCESHKEVDDQSYYFANLCGYSANQHKPYRRYLEKRDELNSFKEKKNEEVDDWISILGIV